MKILVIGLDCAAPEILFGDERFTNFRRLMEGGCYGRLESVIPPITVPAWMSMATSQDPGSLGVYGFRNRLDYSYDALSFATSKSIQELAIWDQLAREGKRSILIGVPPSYPPRKINGICVGCFLTPDTNQSQYTHPSSAREEIRNLVGEYPVDVKGFRTNEKDSLLNGIYEMTRKHFEVIRYFLRNQEWDYFQFVEIGLDRLQHGFWKYHDPLHKHHEPGNPYHNVIRNYYLYLDEEVGKLLSELREDTLVLVLSDHGAQRLDGGFCINEWLIREGLLVLNAYPQKVTPFKELSVNWGKTRVWSEGGYYARMFFNVKDREPNGLIEKSEYEFFRDQLASKLKQIPDDQGKAMNNLVFKPEEIYRSVRNVAPDLICHFSDLLWRSIGSVGYSQLHVQENDTGPDDCNHAQHGAFILAAANNPLRGEIHGVHILDLAPTLLELTGHDIPSSMQGKSIVSGKKLEGRDYTPDDERTIRDRLTGLGYIS
jgi:predicted AlkP superfamily phosphohydrolase/phosphomutase